MLHFDLGQGHGEIVNTCNANVPKTFKLRQKLEDGRNQTNIDCALSISDKEAQKNGIGRVCRQNQFYIIPL